MVCNRIVTDLIAARDLDDSCNVGNGDWPCGCVLRLLSR